MDTWKNVDIPIRMQSLSKDKRGYPVSFTISRDVNGFPDFRRHDPNLIVQAINNKLCSICGQLLNNDISLIAGAKVVLNSNGGFLDPPMHKECAAYALQVCPYLALPSFSKRLPNEEDNTNEIIHFISGKPTVFGLVKARSYEVLESDSGIIIILPHRPFLEAEFWMEGKKVSWYLLNKYLT